MIFWFFVGLTFLGIGILKIQNKCIEKYDCREKETITITGVVVAVLSGAIAFFMLIAIAAIQISVDGDKAMWEQRYKALIYKSQTESIRDEFGIVNKEYIDEIQKWNEDLAKRQSYSHNIWISIFYPKRKYDGLEFIDLENIKMRD